MVGYGILVMSSNHTNRGKQFEEQIEKAFLSVPETSCVRLIDPQGGQSGVANICDYICFHYPHEYFVECKSFYGNRLCIHTNNPKNKYGAISNTQWEGMLKQSKIPGVIAGVYAWYIDYDLTLFIPIQTLQRVYEEGYKSVNIKNLEILNNEYYIIPGTKRRVLFDYDLNGFIGG